MDENKFLRIIGLRIRYLREKANLTQESIDSHGVSYKHLQKIEAGKTNTTLRMLLRLSNAMNCKVKDFFVNE